MGSGNISGGSGKGASLAQGQPGRLGRHAQEPVAEAGVGHVRVVKVPILAKADAVGKVSVRFSHHVIDAQLAQAVTGHRHRRVIAAIDGDGQAAGDLVGAVTDLVGEGIGGRLAERQAALGEGVGVAAVAVDGQAAVAAGQGHAGHLRAGGNVGAGGIAGHGQGLAFRVLVIGLDIATGAAARLADGDSVIQGDGVQVGAGGGGGQGEGVALGFGRFAVSGGDNNGQVGGIGRHGHAGGQAEGAAIIGGVGIAVVSAEDQPGRQVRAVRLRRRVGDGVALRVDEGRLGDGIAEVSVGLQNLQVREVLALDRGIVVAVDSYAYILGDFQDHARDAILINGTDADILAEGVT